MRLLFNGLVAMAIICFGLTAPVLGADLQPGSVWKNDKGSTLTVTSIDATTGVVTGTLQPVSVVA